MESVGNSTVEDVTFGFCLLLMPGIEDVDFDLNNDLFLFFVYRDLVTDLV